MTAWLALPFTAAGAVCAYVAGARSVTFGPRDNPSLVLVFFAGLLVIAGAAW